MYARRNKSSAWEVGSFARIVSSQNCSEKVVFENRLTRIESIELDGQMHLCVLSPSSGSLSGRVLTYCIAQGNDFLQPLTTSEALQELTGTDVVQISTNRSGLFVGCPVRVKENIRGSKPRQFSDRLAIVNSLWRNSLGVKVTILRPTSDGKYEEECDYSYAHYCYVERVPDFPLTTIRERLPSDCFLISDQIRNDSLGDWEIGSLARIVSSEPNCCEKVVFQDRLVGIKSIDKLGGKMHLCVLSPSSGGSIGRIIAECVAEGTTFLQHVPASEAVRELTGTDVDDDQISSHRSGLFVGCPVRVKANIRGTKPRQFAGCLAIVKCLARKCPGVKVTILRPTSEGKYEEECDYRYDHFYYVERVPDFPLTTITARYSLSESDSADFEAVSIQKFCHVLSALQISPECFDLSASFRLYANPVRKQSSPALTYVSPMQVGEETVGGRCTEVAEAVGAGSSSAVPRSLRVGDTVRVLPDKSRPSPHQGRLARVSALPPGGAVTVAVLRRDVSGRERVVATVTLKNESKVERVPSPQLSVESVEGESRCYLQGPQRSGFVAKRRRESTPTLSPPAPGDRAETGLLVSDAIVNLGDTYCRKQCDSKPSTTTNDDNNYYNTGEDGEESDSDSLEKFELLVNPSSNDLVSGVNLLDRFSDHSENAHSSSPKVDNDATHVGVGDSVCVSNNGTESDSAGRTVLRKLARVKAFDSFTGLFAVAGLYYDDAGREREEEEYTYVGMGDLEVMVPFVAPLSPTEARSVVPWDFASLLDEGSQEFAFLSTEAPSSHVGEAAEVLGVISDLVAETEVMGVIADLVAETEVMGVIADLVAETEVRHSRAHTGCSSASHVEGSQTTGALPDREQLVDCPDASTAVGPGAGAGAAAGVVYGLRAQPVHTSHACSPLSAPTTSESVAVSSVSVTSAVGAAAQGSLRVDLPSWWSVFATGTTSSSDNTGPMAAASLLQSPLAKRSRLVGKRVSSIGVV